MRVEFDETVLKQVASEVRSIKSQYRGIVPEESIDALADRALRSLEGSRVTQYVSLFVGRFTRESLQELIVAGRTGSD